MADDNVPTPKLPIPGKRNILITSALPYVNNEPHLGNIIGCVLSADVFAAYCRLRGYNSIFISATDEYGTTTEVRAIQEKLSPKEICDKYHSIHREIYEWFGIKFDKFGRTSTQQQSEICQAIFKKLLDKKLLSDKTIHMPYCITCQRFLADRLVEGVCPKESCKYECARGDQCEKCREMLDPTDLINPTCKVCRTTPQIRDGRHLFLELPLLEAQLVEYIEKTSVAGGWSQNAINETSALLKAGLKKMCITRDLKWGVPVPHEDFKDKVFYVWFDAPIGYISITASYTPNWEKWWKNPDVELYQFMGKDNIKFHTVMFPSYLIGTGENWTMMKTVSVTEYLQYGDDKFSKSKGIGVFGTDVKDTKIPVDVWRYYLLINRPEVSDTSFTWSDLQAKLNNELLSNLGNFIHRVLSFIAKPTGQGYGSTIPDAPAAESHPLTKTLGEQVGKCVEQYVEAMEKVKLKNGLKCAMSISSKGNAYLQETQFWKLYKEDQPSCSIVMKTAVGLVHILACLLQPFMPSFTVEVFKQLNLPHQELVSLSEENVDRARRPWEIVPASHKIGEPKPLFEELSSARLEELKCRYAGAESKKNISKQLKTKFSDGKERRPSKFAAESAMLRRCKDPN